MDFAVFASVLVLDLKRVKDVLPEVHGISSISEGEDSVFRIDAQYTFDFGLFVVDVVRVDGFVAVVTGGTDPKF